MQHRYPACPILCDLYQEDFFGGQIPYPADFVIDWTPVTVTFYTEDKFLHDTWYDLAIECRIPRAGGSAKNSFTVTLYDECFDTMISPLPQRSNYEVDLYFEDYTDYFKGGQTKTSCEAVTHKIVPQFSTAFFPADFYIDPVFDQIYTNPMDVMNVGTYEFIIEACVSVQFITEICGPSVPFTVTIKDSCLTTEIVQIVAAPIYTVMQAAQLQMDELNLQEEMGIFGWPWTDTLSLQLGEPNKCGVIQVELTDLMD